MEATTTTSPEEMVRDLEAVLARRIEQVELENQRLRRLNRFSLVASAMALGVSAAVLAVAGVARSTLSAPTVEAERFVLRSASGETRGEWRMRDNGSTELLLRDGTGRSRAMLTALPDGSTGLSFADGSGNSRVALGLLPDQTTSLVFADRAGRTRAVLGYSPDDAITLAFADRGGVTRAGLGVDAAGQASFTLLEDQVATEPVEGAAPAEPGPGATAETPAAGAPPGDGGAEASPAGTPRR